jgi:hydrogenase maturation protease
MTPSAVLVAGIGNVFFRDDGFGVEVAQRLARERLPEGVRVVDFGIRGVHLAFELFDPPDLLVLVDATPRGGRPGTLYVIDPDVDPAILEEVEPDAHAMHPGAVLQSVRQMTGRLPPTRIVGCEPAEIGEGMGLSETVQEAIAPAIALVRELLTRVPPNTGETLKQEVHP